MTKLAIDLIKLGEVLPALKALKKKLPNTQIYLFGSVLDHTAVRYESDADILIVPKDKISRSLLQDKAWKGLTQLLDHGIVPHVIVFNPKSHAGLLKEVKKKFE